MTTEKKETPPQQSMPQFYPQYVGPAEDEINLVDLWQVLVKRWWLIFSVSVLSVVIAIAYVLSLPKTYQAEVHLLPALVKRYEGFDVFSRFKDDLKSDTAQRYFTTVEKSKAFQWNLSFKSEGFFSVIMDCSDQEQVAVLLNRYIERVALQTKEEIIDSVKAELLQKKITLENTIAFKRTVASQRRADEIKRLSDAFLIAQKLGITNGENYSLLRNVDFYRSKSSVSISLFYQGTRSLQVQIAGLERRISDDHYIAGLRELEQQLIMLNNKLLAINDDFKVMRVVQQAYRPDSPSNKPRGSLIVALGGVLGLMLGIFAAFFFNFVENNRKEEGAEA